MLFNSYQFLIFLPIVFISYWFIFPKNLKYQNLIILISSYIFYGWWDYRFLSLILLSSIVDYVIGLYIPKQSSKNNQKLLLTCSILFNLGLLGFFKYYNFFVDSWIDLINSLGYEIKSIWTLNIVLPVGISFYTFQTMSYTIDIYKKNLEPTRDFISFATFVSFFPQLVAGPIERASNLLPQILNKRKFNYEQGVQGLRLILWGMFKKVVIADNIAFYVDDIFKNYENFGGVTLWLGAIYFAFQIYCDFSGYSDIAIGTSKVFGFELMSNFKFPYFSPNISVFWRRWHISLSTWFRDYLYIPLGGSQEGKWKSIRNIFIIFIVSGFWHGANWTFIFWGLYHSVLFLPSFILNNNKKFENNIITKNSILTSTKELFLILSTFLMVTIGWVIFRSETLIDAINYFIAMFNINFNIIHLKGIFFVSLVILLDMFLIKDERDIFKNHSKITRFFIYSSFLYLIISFFNNTNSFVYFQF